jgi:hypothetical protein
MMAMARHGAALAAIGGLRDFRFPQLSVKQSKG